MSFWDTDDRPVTGEALADVTGVIAKKETLLTLKLFPNETWAIPNRLQKLCPVLRLFKKTFQSDSGQNLSESIRNTP